jgi:hypothetical protein
MRGGQSCGPGVGGEMGELLVSREEDVGLAGDRVVCLRTAAAVAAAGNRRVMCGYSRYSSLADRGEKILWLTALCSIIETKI